VSFVSVTQSFNTTSSMGRLTLNVLLSFAQFEREVIGERVRDKIAASKAKGIWVGGPVPLGYVSVNKKLVVVPEEAETVRLIFRRYLEVGSIRALLEDLDRKGIRTRRQAQSGGRTRGGIRFGVGPLAYLLRNRFLIAEVVYRGAVHQGEQEPIVDRALFEAVQAKLAASATARQMRLRGSLAILAGRIFDDRGNRMTPTHTNKLGVRYRYYVSHALQQGRNDEAGTVSRVSAHDIETTVVTALREQSDVGSDGERQTSISDRELIEQHVDRIIVKPRAIEIQLKCDVEQQVGAHDQDAKHDSDSSRRSPLILNVPWSATPSVVVKGIIHSPSPARTMSPETRDVLLTAIAKARAWIDDLVEGRVATLAEIAKQECKVERHVRFLVPLAFVSPRTIEEIVASTAPSNLTVTRLAQAFDYSWAEQARHLPSKP
jgi:site-specific DNA recombinase